MKAPVIVSLRHIAEELDRYEGYRVEIIGGTLVMSPSPRLKHGHILTKLTAQFEAGLSAEFTSAQGEAVTSPHHGEDYAIPDLMVFPTSYVRTEEWAVPGHDVELVVEVVSVSNASNDTHIKPKWYADAKVARYLLVDPRKANWTLFSEPVDGEYRVNRHGVFGDLVPLSEPLTIDVETDEFLRYER